MASFFWSELNFLAVLPAIWYFGFAVCGMVFLLQGWVDPLLTEHAPSSLEQQWEVQSLSSTCLVNSFFSLPDLASRAQ